MTKKQIDDILKKDQQNIKDEEKSRNSNFEAMMKGGSKSSRKKNRANSTTWAVFGLTIFLGFASPWFFVASFFIFSYMYFIDYIEWMG